jgi:hypothetical protein
MGGTGIQLLFIFVFGLFMFKLGAVMIQQRDKPESMKSFISHSDLQSGLCLLYAITAVLVLIVVSKDMCKA